MKYIDLQNKLKFSPFFPGIIKVYFDLKINLKSNSDIVGFIDEICLSHGFLPLNEEWKELSSNEAEDFFISSLRFDIGFQYHERMPEERAKKFYQELLDGFNLEDCKTFTNWYNNPWINNYESLGINTISDATIDLALVTVAVDKLLFYFISFED